MKHSRNIVLPLLIAFLLLFFTGIYWYGYDTPSVGIDDANIYLVYMKHLAQGKGFVWNVGGEKVEGFTSLLWTLTGSLVYRISAAHVTTLLLALCLVLSFLTLYNITLFARKLNGTEHKAITVTDLVILSLLLLPRGYIEWNVLSIMETSLWIFLLTSICLQLCSYYLRGNKINLLRFSLFVVLLNITRPESVAYNLLFIALLFAMLYAGHGWKYSIRKAVLPLVAHLVSLAALVSWRLKYFGYPFPNTYYAKVSGSKKDNMVAGARYLFRMFYYYPHAAFITVIILFFGVAIIWKKKNNPQAALSANDKILLLLLTTVLFGFGLPVLTGGDHFLFSRFYQPFLPLLYLAVTDIRLWNQYAGIAVQYKKIAAAALVAALVFASAFFSKLTVSDFFVTNTSGSSFPEFIAASNGREAAREMNETFAACKQYPSIGTVATGGVGYVYNGKTIDLMGLNNTIMAHANNIKQGFRDHASFDKKGFWILKPDIVGAAHGGEIVRDTTDFVLYENMADFRSSNFLYLCMKKIQDDEDFRESYLPALVKNKSKDYFVFGYYYKPFLARLDTSLYQVKFLERKYSPQHLSATKM